MIRKACQGAALALLLSAPLVAADEPGYMSAAERQELLDLLAESEARLIELVGAASEEQWNFKPAPGRWSVGECTEHILLSEAALFAAAQQALANPPDPEWEGKIAGKAEFLKRVMPNRNPGGVGGATAPQEIRPQGGLSRDEAIRRFKEMRATVVEYVQSMDQPLKRHIEPHPFPVFGALSAYDWLIYVPLHTVRHSRQIVEVQESEDYPTS